MKLKNRFFARIAACLLALIMAAAVFSSCKLTEDEPEEEVHETAAPVDLTGVDGKTIVMSSKNVNMTMYDFGQEFYGSQYYAYFMYGMMDADQYVDAIVDELSNFMLILNAAEDAGVKLTAEEEQAIDDEIETQLEEVMLRYEANVSDDVEDKRAEARRLIEEDLAADGIDFDTFLELAKINMREYKIADKYYTQLMNEVDVTESDILSYIEEQKSAEESAKMTDFVDKFNTFLEGQGPSPIIVPDDCFSVCHIFLKFDTETDEEGYASYLTDSRAEDEAKLESIFAETAGLEEFMKLEEEYGEDPGMDNEGIRANGYVIHPDLVDSYYPGFVYASMNLKQRGWKPAVDLETGENAELPEIQMFELKDGTEVVKVKTEPGVHYIVINKEFDKGIIPYEQGDAMWDSWLNSIRQERLASVYEELNASWKEAYPIDVKLDIIKAKYLSAE